jgi:hypothetical protein
MTAAVLVAAIGLDSLTFALVWPAQEANVLVHLLGAPAALAIRWAGVSLLLAVQRWIPRPRAWLLAGALSGVVGAASNVWTWHG